MAQPLRALAALPDDPGSISSTYVVAHNCLTPVPGNPINTHGKTTNAHFLKSTQFSVVAHVGRVGVVPGAVLVCPSPPSH